MNSHFIQDGIGSASDKTRRERRVIVIATVLEPFVTTFEFSAKGVGSRKGDRGPSQSLCEFSEGFDGSDGSEDEFGFPERRSANPAATTVSRSPGRSIDPRNLTSR